MAALFNDPPGEPLVCSVLLGGFDFVRLFLIGGMFFCEIMALRLLVSVIAEIRREEKKDYGKPYQGSGQLQQDTRVLVELEGKRFLRVSNRNKLLKLCREGLGLSLIHI